MTDKVKLPCPADLPPAGRDEWHRVVGELCALGIIGRFDRAALQAYCYHFALWSEAAAELKSGAVVTTPSGHQAQSIWVSILNKQALILLRLARELGFTPASRPLGLCHDKT